MSVSDSTIPDVAPEAVARVQLLLALGDLCLAADQVLTALERLPNPGVLEMGLADSLTESLAHTLRAAERVRVNQVP